MAACCCDNASEAGTSWIADVGMNIGTVTLPLLAAGFNVISFEAFGPNANMVEATLRARPPASIATSGQSIIVRKAVSEPGAPPDLCLELAPGSNLGGVKVNVSAQPTMGGTQPCSLSVPTTTLDAEIRRHLGHRGAAARVSAVKMDIEGHEHIALKGATRLFKGNGTHSRPPSRVFVEAIKNYREIDAFMKEHEFACSKVLPHQHDFVCDHK